MIVLVDIAGKRLTCLDRSPFHSQSFSIRNEDGAEVEIINCFTVGYNDIQEQVGLQKSPFDGI